jgi:hypothetical protein
MADKWNLKAVLSAVDNLSPVLKQVSRAARLTHKHLSDIGKSATYLSGKIGLPMGLISGAFAALSVAGIKSAVMSFAELGDQAVKSAQRLGMSTDEYQRLKYSAEQSGVSVEGLAVSMGKLNKGIAMAGSGNNKDLASLFRHAGISMRDARGQLRSSADMLPEIAALFAKNGNAAVQARMGTALFGKGWQELAPLLQGGKAGIDELNARYKMLNLTVGYDALKAGEAFGDQVEDLNAVVKSYGTAISAKLIPILAPMLEKTIAWAVANRDLIATNVTKFIGDLADQLAKVDWDKVIEGIGSFVQGCKNFIESVGGARNALIGLVIVMNLQTISAFVGLISTIGRAAFALGGFAFTTVPAAIKSMGGLNAVMGSTVASGTSLLGVLGQIAAVAAAGVAGYALGTALNDYVINPAVSKLTGEKDNSLGSWLFDRTRVTDMKKQNFGDVAWWRMLPAGDLLENTFSQDVPKIPLRRPVAPGELGGVDRFMNPPSLISRDAPMGGKFTFDFQNAPAGMRMVQQEPTGKTQVDVNVGYRFGFGEAH